MNYFPRLTIGFLIFAIACVQAFVCHGESPGAEWKLTWSDEFDGTSIDRDKWDFDLSNRFYSPHAKRWITGWGNDELQYYTDSPKNAFVQNGNLHIKVVKEQRSGFRYTSARLKTRRRDGVSLFCQTYGRFEIRAKLPTGQGIWPALWMLPQDEKYGPWPASGEIDLMEARGQEPNKILGTLHFGSRWPANTESGAEYVFPKGESFADFHTYALEWEPGEMRWYVDGNLFSTKTFWWSSGQTQGINGVSPAEISQINPWPAPFDQRFYLLMNVAVGGKFLGNPDETTPFPAEMLVDFVRVYQRNETYGRTKPRGDGTFPFEQEDVE